MNLAAIFALLLQSGACAQSTFRGPEGAVLTVIVCPHVVVPGAPTGEMPDDLAPEAPPARQGKRT